MVITGATSGIGLATARAAAKKGAKLVLTARNQDALATVEHQINFKGGRAISVVADVGRKEDVERIAEAAIRHFGTIDTWVNNAGVSIYGRLEAVSDADSRRLFDTNFWGVVYGSLCAVQHMKYKGGAIINLGSELSDISIPLQGMYSASKHAVKGFTDALRIELMEDKAPISVTLIKPAGINTPYTQHAKNYTEQEVTLPPPVYDPEEVVNAILYAAEHPERDILVGSGAKVMSAMNKRYPSLMDWISSRVMTKQQLRNKPAGRRGKAGSLYQPSRDGQVHGDYDGHVMKTSFYTRAALHPVMTGAIAVAAGAAILTFLANAGSSNGQASVQAHARADTEPAAKPQTTAAKSQTPVAKAKTPAAKSQTKKA